MHSGPFTFSGQGEKRCFDPGIEFFFPEAIASAGKFLRPFDMSTSIEPHDNDVLMGRGGKNNQHSGNARLRQLARMECHNYRVSSKKDKSAISRMLVRQMRELNPPARFLKRSTESGEWEEVGEDTAREKASQVLRDAVAIHTEGGDAIGSDHDPETAAVATLSDMQLPFMDTWPEPAVPSADSFMSRPKKRPRRSSHRDFARYDTPNVPPSPMRRRSFDPRMTSGSSSSLRSMVPSRSTPEHPRVTSFDNLLRGELLESDPEDQGEEFPGDEQRDLF